MKKRRAMILSVLTAGVLALTGCGSTQSAETDPEADSTVVENAVDEPNVADETADATASDGDVTTITCATDGHTVKFSYMDENGELAGYEADLLRAIDEQLPQYEFKFEITEFESIFNGLDTGRYQLGFNSLSKNATREEKYIFPNGEVVDYVIIMGYDEHYVGSDAGSVASLSYERDGITGTLENVPKEKIISGIPFYTRLWKTNASGEVSSEAIGMDKADQILSDYKVTAGWSSETSQDYAEFTDEDGNFCQIWLENEASIEEKMKLVQEYGLAGVAEWKLGFERSSIWDVIAKYVN